MRKRRTRCSSRSFADIELLDEVPLDYQSALTVCGEDDRLAAQPQLPQVQVEEQRVELHSRPGCSSIFSSATRSAKICSVT